MTHSAGDQTRGDSSAFFTGDHSAQMSQNEVFALCMKAARGAGMSWGMADEAGFAASWLTARGLDGPRHLLAQLTAMQGRAWGDLCPTIAPGKWSAATGKTICPVVLGATLSDHAILPGGLASGAILTGPVDFPILLCPFLSGIAAATGQIAVLEWTDGHVEIDANGATPVAAVSALEGQTGVKLRVSLRPGTGPAHSPLPAPAIGAQTVAALNAFALRTTVPASDASRAGAGAASNDNE